MNCAKVKYQIEETTPKTFLRADDVFYYDSMTVYEKYSSFIDRIARLAPLVPTPEPEVVDMTIYEKEYEKIYKDNSDLNEKASDESETFPNKAEEVPKNMFAASNTLADSLKGFVPVKRKGKFVFRGMSNFTPDLRKILNKGISGIEKELREYHDRPYNYNLQRAVCHFRLWHTRFLDDNYITSQDCHDALLRVPFLPPKTLHEALQSIWSVLCFISLCGNSPDLGRLDLILAPYLKDILTDGIYDAKEQKRLLQSFFSKITDNGEKYRMTLSLCGSDDEVKTALFILYAICDGKFENFSVYVTADRSTDRALIKKIRNLTEHSKCKLYFCDEEKIKKILSAYGVSDDDTSSFTIGKYGEIQIAGNSNFTHENADGFALLKKILEKIRNEHSAVSSSDELYTLFIFEFEEYISDIISKEKKHRNQSDDPGKWKWAAEAFPCEVVSVFIGDCPKNGRRFSRGGARYNFFSPILVSLHAALRMLETFGVLIDSCDRTSIPDLARTYIKYIDDADYLQNANDSVLSDKTAQLEKKAEKIYLNVISSSNGSPLLITPCFEEEKTTESINNIADIFDKLFDSDRYIISLSE